MKIRTVFMGSPDFALPTLKVLYDQFEVVGVVTQPDRPAGRGKKLTPPDVKVMAEAFGLPLIQPKSLKDPTAMDILKRWDPEVIVVAAFGQILRENVLTLPEFGCVNVHASLLPRWRGAAPIQSAILHDDVSGVTIMRMDKGLDTGPILSQEKFSIGENMTAGKLSDQLAQLGADLLVRTLPKYISGEIIPRSQDDEKATYALKLNKADGLLEFSRSAEFLAREVRAFNPWPGTFQLFNDVRIKVFKAHAEEGENIIPGKRYVVGGLPAWGTASGLLVLDEVQAEGKSRVSGDSFLNGAKDWLDHEEQ